MKCENMVQLSEGEKQLLDAILSLELHPEANKGEEDESIKQGEKLPPNPENLRKRGKLIQESASGKKEKLANWTGAFESLHTKGFVQLDGHSYVLTSSGRHHAERVRRERIKERTGKRFSDSLIRCEKSEAFSFFCRSVFGKDLSQANMMDLVQLEKLLEVLDLRTGDQVLDLGCGIGRIAEYISDTTHARVLGIDVATEAIKRARERTREKRDRLEFREGDMNDLTLPAANVDAIIAIDTLHYVENLDATITQMKAILKPRGQMGLFSFQYLSANDSQDILLPDNTHLARILKKKRLSFRTWDFTEREKEIRRKQLQIATELMEDFRAEGNLDLCEDRIEECEIDLPRLDAGKKRRYLYHIQLP
ncbi:MAG: class I SAM-dependent methyltransferase [Candidatus Odinarchaeota archaeon]